MTHNFYGQNFKNIKEWALVLAPPPFHLNGEALLNDLERLHLQDSDLLPDRVKGYGNDRLVLLSEVCSLASSTLDQVLLRVWMEDTTCWPPSASVNLSSSHSSTTSLREGGRGREREGERERGIEGGRKGGIIEGGKERVREGEREGGREMEKGV